MVLERQKDKYDIDRYCGKLTEMTKYKNTAKKHRKVTNPIRYKQMRLPVNKEETSLKIWTSFRGL